MALTEDLYDLVRCVSDALSKHLVAELDGQPPITGHGYYDPGAVATTACVTWLATHADTWSQADLLHILAMMVDAMAGKHWAYLEGGPKHGG